MEKVTYQDTEVSRPENFMLHREAILRSQYADLARAKATIEELHDNGDLQYQRYYACTRQLSLCMAAVDALISDMQLEAELKWPAPNVDPDKLYIPSPNGTFEITRLRITP